MAVSSFMERFIGDVVYNHVVIVMREFRLQPIRYSDPSGLLECLVFFSFVSNDLVYNVGQFGVGSAP